MGNRGGREALVYHEATKHSEESLRGSPHYLDWENRPISFKLYRDLEAIPSPQEPGPGNVSALAAVAASSGMKEDNAEVIPDLRTLTHVLYYAAGVTEVRRSPGGDVYFRAAPNTGALYHIDLYVVCGNLPDLPAGVYHFGPHDFSLRRLREGDHRATVVEAGGDELSLAAAPVILASASTYWRNAWKYRDRAYRHAYWDGGTLHANLLAAASARGLRSVVLAGFVDREIEQLLGLDTRREGALTLVPLGCTPQPPSLAPEAPVLRLETEPLSPREVDYPTIREMHSASSLESNGEVAAWRGAFARDVPERRGELVELPPLAEADWPEEALESVIRRRGSTRHFDPARSLSFSEFSTTLILATAPFPTDFLGSEDTSLLDVYVIAHAVEGLQPGSYYFRRRERALELLREGEFRAVAGRLGLFQELPSAAAANVYCMAALEPILERYGNRGYRAAQLEGGIVGGRLYLTAYALGFGATGLTFLDDEVTEFFSPHAEGKSAMFLTALGRPVRRRS